MNSSAMTFWLLLSTLIFLIEHYDCQGFKIQFEIEEESRPSIIGDVSQAFSGTTTPDGLRYEIRNIKSSDLFHLEGSFLRTSRIIDYEVTCRLQASCPKRISIKVQSSQDSGFYEIIEVTVTIININDNEPSFPNSEKKISISESLNPQGSNLEIQLESAEDRDRTDLQYRLADNMDQTFGIKVNKLDDGTQQVKLQLLRQLDRESRDQYTLQLLAVETAIPSSFKTFSTSNRGSNSLRTATLAILVMVEDDNDNSPVFQQPSYSVSALENITQGSNLITVQALDSDRGDNGTVRYTFDHSTQTIHGTAFQIESTSGVIRVVAPLDYKRYRRENWISGDQHVHVTLKVMACDLGPNPRTAYTDVTVNIIDVNDHQPEVTFISAHLGESLQVKENSPVGTLVAHFITRDDDTGDNALVECSLDVSSFSLNQLTNVSGYQLITAEIFDREKRAFEKVTLTCSDRGNPPLSATQTLNIETKDLNDNDPQLLNNIINIQINENNDINSLSPLERIKATDLDSGINAELTYKILNPESSELFNVDTEGKIHARVSFDYEKKQEYSLLYTVSDSGVPARTSTGTLSVNIIDQNDNKPTFQHKFYGFRALDKTPAMTSLGHMTARDADISAEFSKIKYTMEGSAAMLVFDIDRNTGEIRNLIPLDRRREPKLSVVVRASDSVDESYFNTATVTIYIDDSNDHAPVFIFPSTSEQSIYIWRNSSAGMRVCHLQAYDSDKDQNNTLTYSIVEGNENETFSINERTGIITLNSVVSHDHTFRLTVAVSDNAFEARRTTSSLSIIVGFTLTVTSAGQKEFLPGKTLASKTQGNTSFITLVAIGCSIVLMFGIVAGTAICIASRKNRKLSQTSKYNCRTESERQLSGKPRASGGEVRSGSLRKGERSAEDAIDCLEVKINENADELDDLSFKTFGLSFDRKLKKGVTFDLDNQNDGLLEISQPITSCRRLSCQNDGNCILHEHHSVMEGGKDISDYPSPKSLSIHPLSYRSPLNSPIHSLQPSWYSGAGRPALGGHSEPKTYSSNYKSEPSLFIHSPDRATSTSSGIFPLMTSSLLTHSTRRDYCMMPTTSTFPGCGLTIYGGGGKLSESDSGKGQSEEDESVFTSGQILQEIPPVLDFKSLQFKEKPRGILSSYPPTTCEDSSFPLYAAPCKQSSLKSKRNDPLKQKKKTVLKVGMESNV